MSSLVNYSLQKALRLYKFIFSPLFGNACRFDPPCSDYAVKAIEEHGIRGGAWLALRRILKCNPFCNGGSDPVPVKKIRSINYKKIGLSRGPYYGR